MIITLCGSAKFEREFHEWDGRLALEGHAVFSLAIYPSDKKGIKDWFTRGEKSCLDVVHMRKIDASDAILVLNKDGYIGESTEREILYAETAGKFVYYLEPAGHLTHLAASNIPAAKKSSFEPPPPTADTKVGAGSANKVAHVTGPRIPKRKPKTKTKAKLKAKTKRKPKSKTKIGHKLKGKSLLKLRKAKPILIRRVATAHGGFSF